MTLRFGTQVFCLIVIVMFDIAVYVWVYGLNRRLDALERIIVTMRRKVEGVSDIGPCLSKPPGEPPVVKRHGEIQGQ